VQKVRKVGPMQIFICRCNCQDDPFPVRAWPLHKADGLLFMSESVVLVACYLHGHAYTHDPLLHNIAAS
jgi:hypothetical protein